MPRKAFVADLGKAVAGVSIAGISNVQPGGDDGEFTFQCITNGGALQITALVPDLAEYPAYHTCMIFVDDAPARVTQVLADITDSATGKTIVQLLELVSRRLEAVDHDGDQQMLNSQNEFEFDDSEDDDGDEYFPDEEIVHKPKTTYVASNAHGSTPPSSNFRQRIRDDLNIAKAHGFKVGHQGGLLDGLDSYVSLSCRIAKLGISAEAMRAWHVLPSEYLVVIFHYPCGYKSMDSLKHYDPPTARRYFEVRVGLSSTYKPTLQEAVRAFATMNKEQGRRQEESCQAELLHQEGVPTGFRDCFISRPLNELLAERFTTLLQYRFTGMSWNGAELCYIDNYGATRTPSANWHSNHHIPENVNAAYPTIVTKDHVVDAATSKVKVEHSLPLVGMQFVLRHFVRCTEFCLICFTKMPEDLQAIKPYVCDSPLCLYQYMSLGFGPSIEHEILSQPKVVDLLISFCYYAAKSPKFKDFPTGLSLTVPPPGASETLSSIDPRPSIPGVEIGFNATTREMLFRDKDEKCPLRTGDWVIIRVEKSKLFHCRVDDVTYFPTVKVGVPVIRRPKNISDQPDTSTATTAPAPKGDQVAQAFPSATFLRYDHNFDEMDNIKKRETISNMLEMLPPVSEMKQYLMRKSQSPLSSWAHPIPPAALSILRWIIASNRACIMQVDEDEERVSGMDGWTQFRFAMGAPDKERRFVQAVGETANRLKLKHPTLYAWHGSPLGNWHSIIREGLHFHRTDHGRAYGHGVYHSLDCKVSIGYALLTPGGSPWPGSELNITSAMALNEIVNAPTEFVSYSPHLVVAQLDWIQTRYLFVAKAASMAQVLQGSATASASAKTKTKSTDCIEQDPKFYPKNPANQKLDIPVNAVSTFRRNAQSHNGDYSKSKRRKTGPGSTKHDPITIDGDDDDDNASVSTLEEDRLLLVDEDAPVPVSQPSKMKGIIGMHKSKGPPKQPLTDFVPGTLNFNTLPMLQQPTWAQTAATRRLMKDFKELIKIQNKEPAHELGWYIDPTKIDNMYQWIVELHSFDQTLPLAKDMKAQGIKSIVLELRFGNQYPMSPPFVRVIRPRFLEFQRGGGGHVTIGGAMCMELLTNNGWSAVTSIESVLVQVKMAISSPEPPARLEPRGGRADYGVGEAIEAYIRACHNHNWEVPAGFKEAALGGLPTTAYN